MLQDGFFPWAFPLGSALFALTLAVIGRMHRLAKGARWAALSFALSMVGVTIDTVSQTLPAAVTAAAPPLHWLSLVTIMQAFLLRHEMRLPLWPVVVLLGVALVVQLWFRLVDPNIDVRLVNSTIVAVTVSALAIIRHRKFRKQPIDRAIVALMAVILLVHLARLLPYAWDNNAYQPVTSFFDSDYLVMFYIAGALISIATALIMLVATGIDIVEHHMIAGRVDPLTGIANRRALDAWIDDDRDGARDFGAVLMIDLDHFKAVNDGYGHAAGDAVLVAVANAIKTRCGTCGEVARVGGEEFAMLINANRADDAMAIAEAVRRDVATLATDDALGAIAVTSSVGIARRAPGEDLKTALRRADIALYRAKEEGRDRVIPSQDEDAKGAPPVERAFA